VTGAPVVGRDGEVAAVLAGWRRLALEPAAGPVVVLVSGEAGIGKSTLLARVLAALEPAPVAVLAGGGRPEPAMPHDWAAQALSGREPPAGRAAAYRALTQQDRGGLAAGPAAPLAAEVAAAGDGAVAPRALLAAGVEVVRAALGDGPGVLVADDLHALDAASLTLIGELARAVTLPALLLATTREVTEAARPRLVGAVVSILASRPAAVRVHLGPLTRAQVAELVTARTGRPAEPALARAVYERTGGNPFWIGELLVAGGDPAALAAGPVPPHLAALVLARLAGEPDALLGTAQAAALLGEQVDLPRLAEVSDLPAPELAAAVDRLTARGLLLAGPDGVLRFRHALARDAVAGSTPPARRRAVLARALAAARRRGDDATVARYAAAAGADDLVPVAAGRAAAAALAGGRPDAALSLARLGLAASPGRPAGPVVGAGPAGEAEPVGGAGSRRELTELAARAAYATGALGEARRHAEDWQALAEEGGDAAGTAGALRLLAGLAWHGGRVAAQWRLLDAALAAGERAGGAEWVRCLAARAQALLRAERYPEAITAADAGLAAGGPVDVQAGLLVDKGSALGYLDHLVEGIDLIEAGGRLADRLGDLTTLGRSVNNALVLRARLLPPDAAWAAYEQAMATAERHGLENATGKLARQGVDIAAGAGWLDRAERAVWRRLPMETDPVERVVLAAKAGLLAVERDDLAAAARLLERCEPDAATMDQAWARTYPALLRVALAARTGPRPAVRQALLGYRDCVPAAGHATRLARLAEAVRWALLGGLRAVDARQVFDGPWPAHPVESPSAVAWQARELAQARAALAEAAGDDRQAVEAARRGLDGPAAQAHLDADTHLRLARCLDRLGDLTAAREHADRAVALLAGWSGWRRDDATRTRRLLGRSATLTPRERDVLRLIAAGQTNHQVGRSLGISARTVAVHVTALLAKTGCASRTEAAVWAVRSGLG